RARGRRGPADRVPGEPEEPGRARDGDGDAADERGTGEGFRDRGRAARRGVRPRARGAAVSRCAAVSAFAYSTRRFAFSAAHRYWVEAWPAADNERVFGRLTVPHGRNYTLDVTIRGPIDAQTGMAIDLREPARERGPLARHQRGALRRLPSSPRPQLLPRGHRRRAAGSGDRHGARSRAARRDGRPGGPRPRGPRGARGRGRPPGRDHDGRGPRPGVLADPRARGG